MFTEGVVACYTKQLEKLFPLDEPSYIGLAYDVDLKGKIHGEPIIGKSTHYFRIPLKREVNIVVKNGIMVNVKPLCFLTSTMDWGTIGYFFIAKTPLSSKAEFWKALEYPITLFAGDQPMFCRGDFIMEIEI